MFFINAVNPKFKKVLLWFVGVLCLSASAQANEPDSTRGHILQSVEITAERQPVLQQKLMPSQILNEVSLERLNPVQLSDAVEHFSGVQVKDYGGIGGLKTVSVRSLGALHTGITYDGVPVGDCQSGQIDLGRFTTENVNYLSLSNGQSPEMLQTARSLALASVLSISTVVPYFDSTQWVKGQVFFKAGSFGLLNPGIILQNKITSKLFSSVNFSWQKADGNYPFTIHNGDSTKSETRQNTDVETYQGEANVYYFLKENQRLFVKASFYNSERGLPGAVILYNPQYSAQRLWDKTYVGQAQYKASFNYNTQLLLSGKYTYAYTRYLDPHALNSQGKVDNEYTQNEYYISGAFNQTLFHNFEYLFNTDLFINMLDANLYNFAYPKRLTSMSGLMAKYNINVLNPLAEASQESPLFLTVQGGVFSTWIGEEVKTGSTSENKYKLSPTIGASLFPFKNNPFQIRFFYKESFRMPTFNDLYYSQVGNAKLKPETAQQLNLGMSYYRAWQADKYYLSASVDAYKNKVTDKILAIPVSNLFRWTMQNIGKVDIKGVDISLKWGITLFKEVQIFSESSYTWQKAINITNPESKLYGSYIPYTPVNSGSYLCGISFHSVSLSYSFTASGERYTMGQNTPKTLLSAYVEQNISASYEFKIWKTSWRVAFDVLNLMDKEYEVVKNYPMPGRWYRGSVWIKI